MHRKFQYLVSLITPFHCTQFFCGFVWPGYLFACGIKRLHQMRVFFIFCKICILIMLLSTFMCIILMQKSKCLPKLKPYCMQLLIFIKWPYTTIFLNEREGDGFIAYQKLIIICVVSAFTYRASLAPCRIGLYCGNIVFQKIVNCHRFM